MTSNSTGTNSERAPGEIITFYSYKGGTGRSMALANVACLLAAQTPAAGRGVLMVDWDLEAPGLHRYFQGAFRFDSRYEEGLVNNHPGLINLFFEIMADMKQRGSYESEDEAASDTAYAVKKCMMLGHVLPLKINNLYLLKAGRFDDKYSKHISGFDWEELHRRWPYLIRALAEQWAEDYDYVLIDSRTGLTDTSGICTMLMPEKLVVVFAPNRQSFTGVENLIRKASKYRKESDDLRPLVVFPLPSRIEASRDDLRKLWRFGDGGRGIVGFQPLFEELLGEVYNLPPEQCDLGEYFDEVQIQQTADYAYGEEIAVRVEQQTDRFSLTRSFQTFTERLVKSEGPWKRPPEENPEQAVTQVPDPNAVLGLTRADDFYSKLSPDEQQRALRLLARLVTVAPAGEGSKDNVGLAKNTEIEPTALPAADDLIKAGLVVARQGADGEEQILEVASEVYIRDWKPLRDWIDNNRGFLFWRQKLKTYLGDWELGGHSAQDLLSGSSLSTARYNATKRPDELSDAERAYINRSVRRLRLKMAVSIGAALFVLSVLAFLLWLLFDIYVGRQNQPSGQSSAIPSVTQLTPVSPRPVDPAWSNFNSDEWARLQDKLRNLPVIPPPVSVSIFYQDARDAPFVRSLKRDLVASGYNVTSVRQRQSKNDAGTLYIYVGTDISPYESSYLSREVTSFVSRRGVEVSGDNVKQKNVPTLAGRAEVWLPKLPPGFDANVNRNVNTDANIN